MKVKSYTIWPCYRGEGVALAYESDEQIDCWSCEDFEVTREEFEDRIVKQAQEPAAEVAMVRLRDNKKILVLIVAKAERAFCYEFQSELGAEMILQLFERTRRELKR